MSILPWRRQPETVDRAWDALPNDRAAQKRRQRHRTHGIAEAQRKRLAWEAADRARFR